MGTCPRGLCFETGNPKIPGGGFEREIDETDATAPTTDRMRMARKLEPITSPTRATQTTVTVNTVTAPSQAASQQVPVLYIGSGIAVVIIALAALLLLRRKPRRDANELIAQGPWFSNSPT